MARKVLLGKSIVREDNWKSYHVPGMPVYTKLKRNAVFQAANITFKHEITKSLICHMLGKHGDFKITDKMKELIVALHDECVKEFKDWPKQKAEFITEACPNDQPNRRVDVVKLDDDTKIEIETNHKINKGDDCITVYI